jgi:osmoprotectant transport system ATP-binding protein
MTEERQSAVSITFDGATKRYPGTDEAAVDHLSLEVPAGNICVLVGPSGCGKTTAMRMVNRLIDITEGDIRLGDTSVKDRKPAELRRSIGYAIQQIGLFPHETIAENIGTVPKLLGWDKHRIHDRVDELINLVSLDPDEVRNRYPAQLSGGQRQRIGVARALAADPSVLLMDEPFGAIDPINRERIQNEFLRLQAEIQKTIVFVTHDIDEAIKMGDKIAVLKKGGHLAQYAAPADLLMNPADEFVEQFVGADRALKRLALQRVRDIDLTKAATVTEGTTLQELRSKVDDADLPIAMLVDERGRPKGWIDPKQCTGDRVGRATFSPADPIIDMDDVLRDALGRLLGEDTRHGAVVDSQGRLAGVLSMDAIAHALTIPAEQTRSSSELVTDVDVDAVD